MSTEELRAAIERYHAETTEDEVYTRGFIDALRAVRHRLSGVLTSTDLGDYDTRKQFTTLVERSVSELLDAIERERRADQ